MADPTAAVRRGTYERDGHHCLRCGAIAPLSYQHRQAVGMGGSDIRPTFPEGVTLCVICNTRAETDLQGEALDHGWKVRRWVRTPELVPVFDKVAGAWFLLDADSSTRTRITAAHARQLMLNVYGEGGPRG